MQIKRGSALDAIILALPSTPQPFALTSTLSLERTLPSPQSPNACS